MDVRIEESWKAALADEFASAYFARLADFVREAYRTGVVYPPARYIFEAFNRTPFDKVKVVIIGQDRIKQRADAPDEPCPTDYRAREQHTEDDTGDAVAAGGIIRYGSDEGGILLHVAIPMDKAAEEHGEQDRGRVKAEHRRCAALIVPAQ